MKEGDVKYAIVPDSVAEVGGGIEADLKDEIGGVVLKLKLSAALDDASVLRMHINEVDAERKRYEATAALLDDIPFAKLKLISKSNAGFTATFGSGNKVVVNNSPFRIDLYKNERIVISGNQRGMLKFEQFRHKGEGDHVSGLSVV